MMQKQINLLDKMIRYYLFQVAFKLTFYRPLRFSKPQRSGL